MDFSEFMSFMFDMQAKFPDLGWEVDSGMAADYMTLRFSIPRETGNLLRDAKAMFEPA